VQGLRRGEWVALASAVLIAHLFYLRIVRYPSGFDAQIYLDIAADIGRSGLFSKYYYSETRTYAYPLLLNLLTRAANALRSPVGLVVFEAQLALYLLAAAFLRRRLAEAWPSLAPWAFASIVLNPFALSYAPESLTESVSLTLILGGAGCWLASMAGRGPAWRPVLAGSLILGTAAMVRPANLFALSAWILAVPAVCFARRPSARAWLSIAAALVSGSVLPMVPQYVNNVRHHGQHTPLVASRLAHDQQLWGIGNIKYATVLPSAPGLPSRADRPRVFYKNPFFAETRIDQEHPLSWYVDNPRAGATTLGLHVFNMLDQDLLFTNSRDLDPWYRIPLGVLNHALIALALLGGAMLAARARGEPRLGLAATALAAYVLAHVALHATTLVEMRFGLPLLLLAGPMAVAAVRELGARSAWRSRAVSVAFTALWIVGALMLSHWVRQQSSAIRAWEKGPEAFARRPQESALPLQTPPLRKGLDAERRRGPRQKKTERVPATDDPDSGGG